MKKAIIVSVILIHLPNIALATQLEDPLSTGGDLNVVIARLIQALLGIVGGLALLMFIWGGFLWLTSMGSPDKIKKGKDTLIWATIGIAIILMAYTLVKTVIMALESGTVY